MSKFSWKSQISNANEEYSLQMDTNDVNLYKIIEKMCQKCVDIKDEMNKVKSGWINVKDDKPKDSSSVLIYTKQGGIAEATYNHFNDTWLQFRWSATIKNVEYWMPLPQPPKGE